MNWQTFLDELKREYNELGAENPPIEVYDTDTGEQFNIAFVYNEDGVISIDVEKVVI